MEQLKYPHDDPNYTLNKNVSYFYGMNNTR